MLIRREQILEDDFKFSFGRHISRESDNGTWQDVRIPHDLLANAPLVEGDLGGGDDQGFSCCFVNGTYKANINIDDTSEEVYLIADGIYRECEIYINGNFAGGSPYGYVPMLIQITDFLKEGNNLFEIYIDNRSKRCDRWYSGAGIYRQISLLHVPKMHIAPQSVFIQTPKISKDSAEISISFSMKNLVKNSKVLIEILESDGKIVAQSTENLNYKNHEHSCVLNVANPKLWSTKSPNIYHAKISLIVNDKKIDSLNQTFGIRKIEFDSENGLFLNGEKIKLCGVNLHHDSGCVGSAFFPEVWREKIEALKKLGLNAIRTSHNPQASIFYDLCDEMGILVIDEIYDKWYSGSYNIHFWDCYQEDVKAVVTRDRNHPCVAFWSVGNELSTQGQQIFFNPLDKLTAEVRKHDNTRPISFGMHPYGWPKKIANLSSDEKAKLTAEIFEHVDVLMCNYQEQWYEKYHKYAPNACIIGSETYHWYTGFGETSSGEIEVHPWNYVDKFPYVLGAFYWAGIDYRGESMSWPARGWTSSLLDITAQPRVQGELAKAYWSDEPTVFVTATDPNPYEKYERFGWSFPHCVAHTNLSYKEGEEVQFYVFTNCEQVDIFQDDTLAQSIINDSEYDRHFKFKIKWKDGCKITAIGKNSGKEICTHTICKHCSPTSIDISTSQFELTTRADSVSVVRVKLLDVNENICETDDHQVTIELENLELLGIDNGNPSSHHSYLENNILTFGGRCAFIVRGINNGKAAIKVSSAGLENAVVEIDVRNKCD